MEKIDKSFSSVIIMYEKQNGKCYYCETSILKECEDGNAPHIDHKIPISKGGSNSHENLCLTCRWCNASKNNKSEQEFVEYLKPFMSGKISSKKELKNYYHYLFLKKKYND